MRTRAAIVIVGVALVAVAGSARAETPTLTGIVGTNDAYVITLVDASGKKVSRIPSGT